MPQTAPTIKISPYQIVGWSQDFCKALNERPLLFKLLFRFIIGKYAYREFIGLQYCLYKAGFSPYYDYDLRHLEYHQNKVPLNFWKEPREEFLDFKIKKEN